ncbi:MAG: magnesium transporter CorA family protein [Candidatus Yonathbacteria bacterium]|nr:magnesium transporter CorA family protein [Candidatus Yonathbacteria bacterium]
MISRYTYKDLVWVDVQSPTQEEVRSLVEEFGIHPLVADELLGPTLRPKVDLYHDFIYLILHFPTITHKHDGGKDQEIDFVIGKKFIITAHYDLVDQLHEFSKKFEVNSILDKSDIHEHAGFILFYILKDLYKMLDGELDHINHDFDEIQSKIFSGKERDMVNSISHINRDLLNFKQILRPHKEVLESFEVAGTKFFGEEFSYYLHTIVGEFYKVSSILDGHRETILDLRDTNDSLLTTKTNDIMKTLTVTAFIILPLTFIEQLFSMDFAGTPLENNSNAFFITVITMSVVGAVLYGYFKFFKKWM